MRSDSSLTAALPTVRGVFNVSSSTPSSKKARALSIRAPMSLKRKRTNIDIVPLVAAVALTLIPPPPLSSSSAAATANPVLIDWLMDLLTKD